VLHTCMNTNKHTCIQTSIQTCIHVIGVDVYYIRANKMGQAITVESLNEKIDALETGARLELCGIPDHIYHASTGIGSSMMREAVKSMAHYDLARIFKDPSSDMVIGTATHTLLLEPSRFDEQVVVIPSDMKKGNNNKYTQFKKDNANKIIFSQQEAKFVENMVDAVLESDCGELFVNGESEKSYWYKHQSGLVLKARIDYEKDDVTGKTLIDLKTTRKETSREFCKSVEWDYCIQDSHYRLVTGIDDMLFVGVSKTKPHDVFLVGTGPVTRDFAKERIEKTFDQILFAEEFNDFSKTPSELLMTN